MSIKKLRNQLFAAIAMVLVASIALGSSTYAWFIQNAKVTATNVQVQATTGYSLLIKGSGADDAYGTTVDLNGQITVRPVSTVGKDDSQTSINGTTKTPQFYRNTAWDSKGLATDYRKTDKTVDSDTYYYTETVYLKAAQKSNIYIDSTSTGVGSASGGTVTLETGSLSDADAKLLATLRVGYLVYDKTNKVEGFYVYQFTGDSGTGSTGTGNAYVTTTGGNAEGITKAIQGEGTDASTVIGNLAFKNLSSGSVKTLADGMVAGNASSFATASDKQLAIIQDAEVNQEYRVDIYVWMEGCDFDTTSTNAAVFGADTDGIKSLQFGFCIGEPTTPPVA